MEEDPNENELEEQFYSLLHYVDDTQANVTTNDAAEILDRAPRSTLRRYWRTGGESAPYHKENISYHKANTPKERSNNSYQKVNSLKEPANNSYQKVNSSKELANNSFQKINTVKEPAYNSDQKVNAPKEAANSYQKETTPNEPANVSYQKVNTLKEPAYNTYQKLTTPKEATNTLNQKANKVNTPNETPTTVIHKANPQKEIDSNKKATTDKAKPKEEKHESFITLPSYISVFESSIPQNVKKTIEFIESDVDSNVVELESSDEDEVIEVALPPKPTITIESSDEDEFTICKAPAKVTGKPNIQEKPIDREISASPVLSIVSSVSDEFIRGDCIALNISSRRPDNNSFDFSLHGNDLLDQTMPSKKRKRKKNKEAATSTPVAGTPEKTQTNFTEECFATPKSKAKNKKQKTKSYSVTSKSVPNADVYDSDSNQSIIATNNSQNCYTVTDISLPSADVYESDSNPSDFIKNNDKSKHAMKNIDVDGSDSSSLPDKMQEAPNNLKRKNSHSQINDAVVDLTDNSIPFDNTDIHENIVLSNVTGFTESDDYGPEPVPQDHITEDVKFGSTRVPAILYENLDFDNLKGKDTICKKRKYSLTTLRAEMEKFYNESWGGEDFNHREIQKNMSRDKSLWVIDPKDRMPTMSRRRQTCNYCNRVGHRDETCRMKPPVCYMCGDTGHIEPRCPSKICVNCGSPNHMYSAMCRNCATWGRIRCAECGQNGHPASHCPDMWRRYHNTIDITTHLEENRLTKKHYQLFCSGCTRRGHLVHTCRLSLPFSGLPMNSPYVHMYRPVYTPMNYNPENLQSNITFHRNIRQPQFRNFPQDSTISSATTPIRNERNKRQSKSPTVHETHATKKRNMSTTDTTEVQRITNSPVSDGPQRKMSQSEDNVDSIENVAREPENNTSKAENPKTDTEKAPDFIPIGPTNRDKKGQMIQDNEVSDTSDVVTSARIYITNDLIDKLKSKDGEDWLKEIMDKINVTVENTEINSFLSIKGKVADQEAFQLALRDWAKVKPNKESAKPDNAADISEDPENELLFSPSNNIPKNRNNVLRKLNKALDSLKSDIGEPNAIYKELNYLEKRHQQLLTQKVINPQQLSTNRNQIKEMLKKLNMVLLGQAGLADGSQHLSELYSLQEKLINYRQKNIPAELRKQIGQHFHFIFAAIPRSDYVELLKSYYGTKPTSLKKKKEESLLRLTPNKKKKFNAIPAQQKIESPGKEVKENADFIENQNTRKSFQKTINKLVFYHRRLMNARPNDAVLKKRRVDLVRKLHSHIASLNKNANTSSKALKKMKKLQEQAQLFLNNV